MTNEQLVARIRAGEDAGENMEQLYQQVKAFIHSLAWRYRNSGELEDLEQEGYLALYPAIEGYDPEQGIKFLTYAKYHIKQQMQHYLQVNGSCMRFPVHCLKKVQQYKKFCNAFQIEYGRKPSDREAAERLALTMDQIESIKKQEDRMGLGSLDAPVKGADAGEDITAGDMVASDEDLEGKVVEQIETEQLHTVLWGCVDTLPGQQPQVLRKCYQKNMTMEAIGQGYGTSGEAVRQIHARAIRELRKPRNRKQLQPFLPELEYIYSRAVAGTGIGRFNRTWASSTERTAFEVMAWKEERHRK